MNHTAREGAPLPSAPQSIHSQESFQKCKPGSRYWTTPSWGFLFPIYIIMYDACTYVHIQNLMIREALCAWLPLQTPASPGCSAHTLSFPRSPVPGTPPMATPLRLALVWVKQCLPAGLPRSCCPRVPCNPEPEGTSGFVMVTLPSNWSVYTTEMGGLQ